MPKEHTRAHRDVLLPPYNPLPGELTRLARRRWAARIGVAAVVSFVVAVLLLG